MNDGTFVILGANGQLGRALKTRFPQARTASHSELDIADWDSVQKYDWSQITVILNAAAYTNVDGAETPEGRQTAWQVNAQGPANLAKVATLHDLTLVHFSSEYVFDGTHSLHSEDEPLTPLGVYAQTKAAGDVAAAVAPKHYIVRTSWVVGDGKNFVRIMIGLAEKNISPTVVTDQVGRLSFADVVAESVAHLFIVKAAYGVYNVSNDGEPASWADVTRAIFQELGRSDLNVTDTTTAAYFKDKPGVAPRPLQSVMDLSKIKATGFALRDWRQDLHNYIMKEKERSI